MDQIVRAIAMELLAGLVHAAARGGVLRIAGPTVVVGRPVGVAIVVAPIPKND